MPDSSDAPLHNRKHLKQRRQQLRNTATPAEAELWTMVQKSQLMGRKFRRQHSIGPYIVDFNCPAERLIIELDGAVHDDPVRWWFEHREDWDDDVPRHATWGLDPGRLHRLFTPRPAPEGSAPSPRASKGGPCLKKSLPTP